jgi:hypothetical protein
VSPTETRADATVVGDLVRSVASLRAERFVDGPARPEHGLARPRFTLRVRFEGAARDSADAGAEAGARDAGAPRPRDYTIVIGAETEDGSFARLEGEDQAVFVVADELYESLGGPLVDRDLFAVQEDGVQGLVIERGTDRLEIRRGDDGWRLGGEAAPEGSVEGVVTRLAVVRATEAVAFGAPAAELGLSPPRLRATIELDDEDDETPASIVLLLGAEYAHGEERLVYGRREDVDATLGLPIEAVEPLLELGLTPDE